MRHISHICTIHVICRSVICFLKLVILCPCQYHTLARAHYNMFHKHTYYSPQFDIPCTYNNSHKAHRRWHESSKSVFDGVYPKARLWRRVPRSGHKLGQDQMWSKAVRPPSGHGLRPQTARTQSTGTLKGAIGRVRQGRREKNTGKLSDAIPAKLSWCNSYPHGAGNC